MIVAADTSVVVAAVVEWHEHHAAAAHTLNRLLDDGALLLPSHVLLEAYSVLTRLPASHRVAPSDAFRLLSESFANVPIASLPADEVWPLLEDLAKRAIAGGRAYDAGIARVARIANADSIVTLNAHDFEAVGDGLRVVTPPPAGNVDR